MNRASGEGGERMGSDCPAERESHARRETEAIWAELLAMANGVAEALTTAVEALCESRPELFARVVEEEAEIDRWEVRIEQRCLRALALYDLVASDLRRVVGAIRINRELEGLSDLAENLARRARKLSRDPLAALYLPRIRLLAKMALELVGDALRALGSLDSTLAREVIERDRAVNLFRAEVVEELKLGVREHPERVSSFLRLINSARNLERAADHARKVSVVIVYAKEGVLIHAGREDEA